MKCGGCKNEPYLLVSESSQKRIWEFFFWYLVLKSSTKIGSLNIRRYLRENYDTRKTGSMLILACKENIVISLNCTFFHLLAHYGAAKYVLLILITHKVGTCWHSGHWEIFRYLHFSWFMWKWKHKGRGGKPKKVFAILDTESYKYKYNYFINRFLM